MRVSRLCPAALSAALLLLSACSGHSGSTLALIEADAASGCGGAMIDGAPPQPLAVHGGDPALFQVATTGTEPATYQWERDGQPIPGATGRAYQLPATTLADHGARFRVVVINDHGAVISDVGVLSVVDETGRWAWE